MSICNFGCFPFWFRWLDCFSDTPVPGHCLSITLQVSCRESYCILRISVCEFVMFQIHSNKKTHLGFTEKTRKVFAIAQGTGSIRTWRQPGMEANYPSNEPELDSVYMRQRCKIVINTNGSLTKY